MKIERSIKLAVIGLSSLISASSMADIISGGTEEYPPYTHAVKLADGKDVAGGWCTTIVKEIAKAANVELGEIEVAPWAKVFNDAKNRTNFITYAAMKSPERIPLFYFVGPIIKEGPTCFLRLSGGRSISSVEEAKSFKTSVTSSESASAYLQAVGFELGKNIIPAKDYEIGIKNLYAGRLDFIYMTLESAQYIAKTLGLEPSKLEVALEYQMDSTPAELYVILKKDPANLELSEKLQKALDDLKSSGKYDEILAAAKAN